MYIYSNMYVYTYPNTLCVYIYSKKFHQTLYDQIRHNRNPYFISSDKFEILGIHR